ncbi:DNA cytosine methyltransferase [Burkholderia cenocepacia]|uniref:DNA cytosine methyltransferase n=1 Tax=Burkholderia cenocepacia TaxID=95486 RepID=UPI002231439A|nr:DNA cytosine methyltransferase [Burkholderia cenocepacia]MCW3522086.1 DNA cytosine methyltransferase [Burkholderia cenocepacia]MCW3617935.1 DNA cytosine methyltransferase [Burkholderia cenocepacia]MCW3655830.1 DNA cytosine methyltransferase [Burkholderia cenocepacia]MCW3670844.1 DNA cytosine methyltransferase [Burkholderia cenocepacia]MCW3685661.1 DNA cytosine methyltransferase [Burkholderia cenocepacia]
MNINREYKVFGFCSGLGAGMKGFKKAVSRVGTMTGTWRVLGGIDNDPAACRDFRTIVGVPCTLMDLFTRNQYTAFHSAEPPAGWREATPEDVRRAAGYQHPHCVFISSPCKGASGLLSETLSRTPKYQALNELTLRCVWLMCEAWKDDPVELIVFENVPRLATRGRHLLDQIGQILRHYGYAVNETTHDCGVIGGLAQSRKRFLLVARHMQKVPACLYEPPVKRLQGVGTLLGRMPLPGNVEAAGPMHRVPSLQWKTWVRLAFVEAGSDWRSLNKLAVENGQLRDYLIVPERRGGHLGVIDWNEPAGTVAGESLPTNGAFSVADPRGPADAAQYQQYGVLDWNDHAGTITGQKSPGQGTFSVADPRHQGPAKHNNEFRIIPWRDPAGAVTSAHGTGQCVQDPRPPAGPLFSKYKVTEWAGHAGTVIGGDDQGAYAVADPRASTGFEGAGKYRVTGFDEPAGMVIARSDSGQGAFAVADPRPGMRRERGDAYLTGGHYGVVGWDQHSGAVSAAAGHDNGRWSVADPRMPAANEKTVAVIRALDGTWHRPFTTLELAVLQSLVEPEEYLELDGLSDQAWRERIGNAVPPDAAQAIAEAMGTTLLLAESGETFQLSSTPVWVRPIAIALTVAPQTF